MLLGITMGDAAGVGPEIVLRAYAQNRLARPFVVIGDAVVLVECLQKLSLSIEFNYVESLQQCTPGLFNVYDMKRLTSDDIVIGSLSQKTGYASYEYLIYAVKAALNGTISAIVTLPVNKEAVRLSVPEFTGHTDVIAQMCGTRDYTMTLITDRLVVPHVSAHISLRDAVDAATTPRILQVIQLTNDVLRRLKRKRRIAVLGLNPHAGEGGAFGREDIEEITPAVAQAQKEGIDATGPIPADTAFMRALRGDFEAVVCMYHDQGHAPMKTIGFDDGVNVTVGLPIVRTSVDHGTAFDIAWQGSASVESFVNACNLGYKLSTLR